VNINKFHFIKYLVVSSFTLFVICSCSGTLPSSDPEFIEDYRTFKVKQLGGGKYFIGFKGTPLTTVEEAREEWDYKAKQVCGGVYQYLGEYNQENYEEEKGAERSGNAGSGSAGAACAVGGALGCIIASLIVGDFGKKEYPIINGTVECSTETTPEEDLANSSGHEKIPHAAPRGCVWVRDSSTKKYELDCEEE
jgi:hypothetical protein